MDLTLSSYPLTTPSTASSNYPRTLDRIFADLSQQRRTSEISADIISNLRETMEAEREDNERLRTAVQELSAELYKTCRDLDACRHALKKQKRKFRSALHLLQDEEEEPDELLLQEIEDKYKARYEKERRRRKELETTLKSMKEKKVINPEEDD